MGNMWGKLLGNMGNLMGDTWYRIRSTININLFIYLYILFLLTVDRIDEMLGIRETHTIHWMIW
jgi:hypothetical protein